MCILLYVKFIWCSGIPFIYGQSEVGYICLGICVFCYKLNLFGEVLFHRSLVNWRKGSLVYVYSAICETYLVYWYFIHLWSIGGWYMWPRYMCILLYVKFIWCGSIC